MTCTFQFDFGPNLGPNFGVKLMAAFDALSAKIQEVSDSVAAGKADVLAKIDAEKQQVADAIAALEASMGDVLTADQLAALTGSLEALKTAGAGTDVADAVQGIFEPPTPPDA